MGAHPPALAWIIVAATSLASSQATDSATATPLPVASSGLAVRAARLIDGRSAQANRDAVVIVQGERIVAIGGQELLTPGLETIDLGDATLMPGLIDAHSHPLITVDDYQTDHLKHSSAYKALRGLKAVQDDLRAGMTPMQAIQAATRVGSELLGWEDRIGTVGAGKLADLVAVPGDPLADLALLAHPSLVMVGGRRGPLECAHP